MFIESVRLRNFRNYRNQSVEFKNGMNLILGANGVGKTNLLESIYLLSTTRSHRSDDEKSIICFDEEFAAVEGVININNKIEKLDVILHKSGKTLSVNKMLVKKNSEFIGKLNAILFSPSDMNLFDSSPKDRRKMIDMELGKLSNAYMINLSDYLKNLKQRNAYLKNHYVDDLMLETYNEMLYGCQIAIMKERKAFIDSLNNYLSYFYSEISGEKNQLQIVYKSFIKENQDEVMMKKQMKQAYEDLKDRDIMTKMTNTGVHREDYDFFLNQLNVAKHCSQGQKRMVILAIKLSFVQIIYQIKREYPILLLDDVFSELDSKHRTCLLRLLPNSVQTIITTTDVREVNLIRKQDVNIINIGKGMNKNG